MPVQMTIENGVLIAVMDNPPVNALGAEIRAGLAAALDRAEEDEAVAGIVFAGAGERAFSGGADIREFGRPPAAPFLPELLDRIERSPKPALAAIGGVAMGGGLELALACRFRIASPGARFALPEVKIGLIPGAGGTQRLPRLVGLKEAAAMIASGETIDARKALDIDLVDALAERRDLGAAGADWLARRLALGDLPAPLCDAWRSADRDADWLAAFEARQRARARGQVSPMKALEAVRASLGDDFADGLAAERRLFLECLASDQRKALIHAFFGERAVAKVSRLDGVAAREANTVGVIGAGLMGTGIATALAQRGFRVLLYDIERGALDTSMAQIAATIRADVAKGRVDAGEAEARIGAVSAAAALEELRDCDLVIEAALEDMAVKKELFARLDAFMKKGAVLATNTSYLDIDEIAAATQRPEDVIGMHFFSPAHVMRLLEVVWPKRAAPDAVATAMEVGRRLGKVCVVAGVADGFIGNRLFKRYRTQAEFLVQEGAEPETVDRAMRDFGFAMGPFEVADLAGLDIGWRNRRREDATRDPAERYADISDRLYEAGRLGQKTGAGWYRYEAGSRAPIPDPAVGAVIAESARKAGIARRKIDDEEIRDRLLLAMINEGARTLEDGTAARAVDIDMVFLHGYGFPAHRGGPMFYADALGAARVLERLEAFAAIDAATYAPAPLIRRLAREGKAFGDS